MRKIITALRASFMLVVLMTVLLGGVYPLVVMGVTQTLFEFRANGSLIERGDKVIGSGLLGQEFTSPKYFWGRLSATTPPYNATASAASNFSPANPKLLEAANARMAILQQSDPGNRYRVPVELVTASGSGLDPHISMAAAEYQIPRIARARKCKEDDVRMLMLKYKESPGLGWLGEPYVNVLRLNLALDEKMIQNSEARKK